MNTKSKVVTDITPNVRIVTAEIQKNIFNRNYSAFIIVLLLVSTLMAFTVSQLYETQKDLKELKESYELNSLLIMKIEAKNK